VDGFFATSMPAAPGADDPRFKLNQFAHADRLTEPDATTLPVMHLQLAARA
jgi:hypothetical protein